MKTMFTIIIAGIIGTGAMTFCMYLATFIIKKVMKVVKILGTMLTFQTTKEGKLSDKPFSIFIGLVAHYLIGIFFVIIYYILWKNGIGKPNFFYGAIFGFLSGLFGIIVWRIFFAIHPNPPKNINLKDYFINLVIAHIIFGIVVSISFLFIYKRLGLNI